MLFFGRCPLPDAQEAILANVVKGLRSYLEVVGDTMVPQGFVVPDGEAWPEECRGQKLGKNHRRRSSYVRPLPPGFLCFLPLVLLFLLWFPAPFFSFLQERTGGGDLLLLLLLCWLKCARREIRAFEKSVA